MVEWADSALVRYDNLTFADALDLG